MNKNMIFKLAALLVVAVIFEAQGSVGSVSPENLDDGSMGMRSFYPQQLRKQEGKLVDNAIPKAQAVVILTSATLNNAMSSGRRIDERYGSPAVIGSFVTVRPEDLQAAGVLKDWSYGAPLSSVNSGGGLGIVQAYSRFVEQTVPPSGAVLNESLCQAYSALPLLKAGAMDASRLLLQITPAPNSSPNALLLTYKMYLGRAE